MNILPVSDSITDLRDINESRAVAALPVATA